MSAMFQFDVGNWMLECFGPEISKDTTERNHRFLEEALELVQSCDCTKGEAHQLVDYVFNRPIGEKGQEVGGVMVTLAALCEAQGLFMFGEGDKELERVNAPDMILKIRAKQAAKPKNSPLPEAQNCYSIPEFLRGENPPPLRHLIYASDEERRALAYALLGLQMRDGNNTRNPFLSEVAMAVHEEETIRLCTR